MGGLPLRFIYIYIPVLARTGKLRRGLQCNLNSKPITSEKSPEGLKLKNSLEEKGGVGHSTGKAPHMYAETVKTYPESHPPEANCTILGHVGTSWSHREPSYAILKAKYPK
jgi:hypothetical protein